VIVDVEERTEVEKGKKLGGGKKGKQGLAR